MQICNGNITYKCSNIKTNTVGETEVVRFTILEPASVADVANIFEDGLFYFYDDVLNGRFIETNNKKLVGLSITYNADSTVDIKIKLTKGDVYDES